MIQAARTAPWARSRPGRRRTSQSPTRRRHDERLEELQQDQRVARSARRDGRTAWIAGPRGRGSATPPLPIPGSTTGERATTRRWRGPARGRSTPRAGGAGARSSSLARAPTSAASGIRPSTLFVRMAAPSGTASASCHRGLPRASRYTHTVAVIQNVRGTSIIRRRALSTKIGVARRLAVAATAAARPTVSTPIRQVRTQRAEREEHRGEPRGEVVLAEGVGRPGRRARDGGAGAGAWASRSR